MEIIKTAFRFFVTVYLVLPTAERGHANAASDLAKATQKGAILESKKINHSTVEVGAFAVMIHGQGERHPVSGEWERLETSRGYIQAIDAETLILSQGGDGRVRFIALERIQTLVLVGKPSRRARERMQKAGPDGLQIMQDSLSRTGREDKRLVAENTEVAAEKNDTRPMALGWRNALDTKTRVAGKLLSGGFFGGISGYTLAQIGIKSMDCRRGNGDGGICEVVPAAIGGFSGLSLGASLGVTIFDSNDHWFLSFVGSLVGIVVGIGPVERGGFENVWPLILGASGGATLGSELSRLDSKTSEKKLWMFPYPQNPYFVVAIFRL